MKLSTFLAVAGALATLFGLGFLLVPAFALAQYGVPTDPHNLMQARYFGTTLLSVGLIFWLARRIRDDDALRAILLGGTVGNGIGAIISAWAALAGLQNALAWSSVAIYGLLCLGGIYFLGSATRRVETPQASR
jgi:hypothetical protein